MRYALVLFALSALPASAQVVFLAEPTAESACPCGITGCSCPAGECDCVDLSPITDAATKKLERIVAAEMLKEKAAEKLKEFQPPEGRLLYLLTQPNCPPCPGAKANALASGVPVQIIDITANMPFAESLWAGCSSELSTPSWVLTEDGKPVKHWKGQSSPYGVKQMLGFEASLPTGTPAGVVATSQAASVGFTQPAVTRSYVPPDPRPGHWSHPGDIKSHLMSGPHRFSAAELEGLSYEQLKTLHDMNHESGYRPQRVTVQARQVPLRNQVQYAYRQPVRVMRSCPTCPGR